MRNKEVLDSLKEILTDPDSMLNALQKKKTRLEGELNLILQNNDIVLEEKDLLLNKKRQEIADLDKQILTLFSSSFDLLKKQED